MERVDGALSGGFKVLNLILSVMGVFLILLLLLAGCQGLLNKKQFPVAIRVLKGEDVTTKVIVEERPPIQEIQAMTIEKELREASYKEKERDLEAMEGALRELQMELQAKQNEFEAEKQAFEQQRKKSGDTGARVQVEEMDASFRANVTLFSKMDAEEIAGLMETWGETQEDDKKIRSYIRAMKPSLAAEVVALLRADAGFNKRDNEGKLRMNRILLEE